MADFDKLELVVHKDNIISGKEPIRIYRTTTQDKDGITTYRYHIGFPEKVVKILCPLLETTPYWGEQHWKEIDGFWLWWTAITGKGGDDAPFDKLNRELDWRLKSANKVLQWLRKSFA